MLRSKEPIFGEGAMPFFVQLVGLAFAFLLITGTLLMGRVAYSTVRTAMFGPEQTVPHLEPGESTVVNGFTIKRIN
jgi:hypothetical protein